MHIKRLLAVLLSTAMFITSGFSSYATADTQIAIQAAAEASEDLLDEADADAYEEAAGESTEETSGEASEEAEASEEETGDAAASEDTSVEAGAPDEQQDASEDASSSGASEEVTDAAEEASSEDAADAASSEDSAEEIIEEEDKDLFGGPMDPSSFLDTDENGVLRIAEGKTKDSFTATAVIPKEAKVIPVGLFNCNDTKLKVVKFEERDAADEGIRISAGAFEGSSVVTFDAGDVKVTEIGEGAFKYSALKNVSAFNDVETIGKEAFLNTEITSFRANSAKTVGDSAFNGCDNLTSVNLPSLVTIGAYAFSSCSALDSSFVFATSVESIGASAFIGCRFTSLDFSANKAEELSLGTKAFENNASLKSVKLGNNVKIISNHLFYNCTKLENVTLGTAESIIYKIDTNAFGLCSSLKSIVAQKNLYIFADKAFYGCSGLETITINYPTPNDGKLSIAEGAFPSKSGIVMKGYGGEVQTYAEKQGYEFKPIRAVKINNGNYDTVKVGLDFSKKEAVAGEKVTVTVTPKGEYVLKEIKITDDTPVDVNLVKVTEKSQVFEFQVPDSIDGITTLRVDVTMVEPKSVIKNKLAPLLKEVDGYTYSDRSGNTYTFDMAGRRSRLVVYDGEVETGSWLWNFTSTKPGIATVSAEGIIRAVKAGSTEIVATLKTNEEKKVNIYLKVTDSTEIGKLKWNMDVPDRAVSGKTEIIDGKSVPVYVFNKNVVKRSSFTFEAAVQAFATTDADCKQSLVVATNWKSVDTSIAALSTSKSETNTNKVTIKKGAVGETMVTVTVTNEGEKEPADTLSFIIRVIDYTPRLGTGKITVNSLSKVGTPVKIIPVYDTTIAGDDLHLYTKRTDKKGVTEPVPCTELDIYEEGGYYYIYNPTPGNPFSATYKGSNQLYIVGYYDETADSFEIPIPELTVTKTTLNPTIKTTGKINLFYNHLAEDEESGVIKLTQSIKDVETHIELVSTANYKKPGSETPDKFANNFTIERENDQTFYISRTGNEMLKDGKNNVVSGYLKITYKGYANPVYKAIKLSTCDTAPSYVLSKTSATASTNEVKQEYDISLLDKKTKTAVDLSMLDDTPDGGNFAGLSFDESKTTSGLFEEIENADAIHDAQGNNYISLKVKDRPVAGKAVFYVQMKTWSRPLTYTFTLKTTNNLPKVKLSASSVTLNKAYKSRKATITFTDDQEEAKLTGFRNIKYVGSAKHAASATKISVVPGGDDTIDVSLPENVDDITATTYTYQAEPLVEFNNSGKQRLLSPVKFKVVVGSKVPTLKLKSGTLTFNSNYVGEETVSTTYTLGNLPTGETEATVSDNGVLVPTGNAPAVNYLVDSYDFDDGTLSMCLSDDADMYNGKTFTYKVTGLKVTAGSDTETVPDFKVAVKLKASTPAVKIKTSGSINPIDSTTAITVTATVANVVTTVKSVDIWEKNERGSYFKHDDGTKYSENFDFEPVVGHADQATIMVKEGKAVESGKKYNVTLCYKINVGSSDEEYTVNYTVVPKQVIPSIKVGSSEATIYAGQTDRTFTTTVEVVPGKTFATTISAELVDVYIPDDADASIKKAFGATFDKTTGKLTLELKNPAAIVLDKTYNVPLVTKYERQADKSVANKFTIKVTVKK